MAKEIQEDKSKDETSDLPNTVFPITMDDRMIDDAGQHLGKIYHLAIKSGLPGPLLGRTTFAMTFHDQVNVHIGTTLGHQLFH